MSWFFVGGELENIELSSLLQPSGDLPSEMKEPGLEVMRSCEDGVVADSKFTIEVKLTRLMVG